MTSQDRTPLTVEAYEARQRVEHQERRFASSGRAVSDRQEKLEREIANAARRARRRLPTRHAVIISEMKRACLLPAPGPDISEAERRAVRNKLKAMRRAGR